MPTAIVNQALVDRYWPGENAIASVSRWPADGARWWAWRRMESTGA